MENRLEKKKNQQSLRDLWDYNKRPNMHVTGVPEGEEKEAVAGKYPYLLQWQYYRNGEQICGCRELRQQGWEGVDAVTKEHHEGPTQ